MKKIISTGLLLISAIIIFCFNAEIDPISTKSMAVSFDLPFNLYIRGMLPFEIIQPEKDVQTYLKIYIVDIGIQNSFKLNEKLHLNSKLGLSYINGYTNFSFLDYSSNSISEIYGLTTDFSLSYKFTEKFGLGFFINFYHNFYCIEKSNTNNNPTSITDKFFYIPLITLGITILN